MIVNLIPVNRETTSLKKIKNRQFDFEIETGYVDELSYVLTLPSGYKMPQKFTPINLTSSFGEYHLEIEPKDQNSFYIKRTYKQLPGVFPKDQYNDYVDFRRKIAGFDNTKLLLEK